MYIYIDDKEFWIDSGCFPEKISRMDKMSVAGTRFNYKKTRPEDDLDILGEYYLLENFRTGQISVSDTKELS